MGTIIIILVIVALVLIVIGFYFSKSLTPNHQDDHKLNKKYFLGCGAIFKNEGHIIEEWIEHYRREGFEHIYLVDDHSNDDYLAKIQRYIDEGYVSLYRLPDDTGKRNKQYYALEVILYPVAKEECEWFIAPDLDEFVTTRTSPQTPEDERTVKAVLKKYFSQHNFIKLPGLLYGSNQQIEIPESAVRAYTRRANVYFNNITITNKTLCRPNKVTKIDVHYPRGKGGLLVISSAVPDKPRKFWITENNLHEFRIVFNHYQSQALEFWKRIKMTRGDSAGMKKTRGLDVFDAINQIANEIEDTNLRDKSLANT